MRAQLIEATIQADTISVSNICETQISTCDREEKRRERGEGRVERERIYTNFTQVVQQDNTGLKEQLHRLKQVCSLLLCIATYSSVPLLTPLILGRARKG